MAKCTTYDGLSICRSCGGSHLYCRDRIRKFGTIEIRQFVDNVDFVIRRILAGAGFMSNATLSDNAVTNFTAMTHRRIYWIIGVEYASTVEQLRQIRDAIEEYVTNNADFASPDEGSTFIRIDSFNDSSIDILLYCFTRTTEWGEWLNIKKELAYKVKEIVEGARTGFALPSRSLYVHTVSSEKLEVFTPPSGS